jgi:hypothetical protein
MLRTHSQPWIALPFAVIGLAAYWFASDFNAYPRTDREAMIGEWVDEAGEPGNSIRFYFVEVDIPGAPWAKGLEGHAEIAGWLGEKQAQAIWNYGYWDPLVLNVIIGKKVWYAAIRKLDDDHILIRFGADPTEMMRSESLDHPDTKRLTRIGRE